jgi:hypothetical protein
MFYRHANLQRTYFLIPIIHGRYEQIDSVAMESCLISLIAKTYHFFNNKDSSVPLNKCPFTATVWHQ